MRHKVFAVSLSQTRPKRNGARRVTHPRPLLSDDKDPTRASHGIRSQKPTGFSLVHSSIVTSRLPASDGSIKRIATVYRFR